MKTRTILMLALSAMLIMSCSREAIEAPITDTADLEMNFSNDGTKAPTTIKIFMEGFGTMKMVKPTECLGLNQVEMEGMSQELQLGRFKTITRNCTDFGKQNYIKGMHISMESGDKLYFESEVSGIDDEGKWYNYVYVGGTGKYKDVKGEIKYHSSSNGAILDYKNHGEGYLIFPDGF